jgi:hypothetical protein
MAVMSGQQQSEGNHMTQGIHVGGQEQQQQKKTGDYFHTAKGVWITA